MTHNENFLNNKNSTNQGVEKIKKWKRTQLELLEMQLDTNSNCSTSDCYIPYPNYFLDKLVFIYSWSLRLMPSMQSKLIRHLFSILEHDIFCMLSKCLSTFGFSGFTSFSLPYARTLNIKQRVMSVAFDPLIGLI